MKIKLIAVGTKMPAWVSAGFLEYRKRLPKDYALQLIEVPLIERPKNADIPRLLQKEGMAMLSHVDAGDKIIVLDVAGKAIATEALADKLRAWHDNNENIAFLIGSPEGLSPAVKACAHEALSLSALTFAHPLVRIIIAEQLYRAVSIIQGHPYHRA